MAIREQHVAKVAAQIHSGPGGSAANPINPSLDPKIKVTVVVIASFLPSVAASWFYLERASVFRRQLSASGSKMNMDSFIKATSKINMNDSMLNSVSH